MKYQVTVGTFWHEGKKYRRGDVIEIEDEKTPGIGSRLTPAPEKPKAKVKAKPATEEQEELL